MIARLVLAFAILCAGIYCLAVAWYGYAAAFEVCLAHYSEATCINEMR